MTQPVPSPSSFLKADVTGHVATVTIDRAVRRNAFDTQMWQALPAIVSALEERGDVRVMVLRGAGEEAFSAGADISEFAEKRATAQAARSYDEVTEQAYEALKRSPVPSIAMIHGFCLGGGLGLALACDLRFASEEAVFAIPAARLGLAYPFSSLRHLVAIVGPDAAKDLIFTARRIHADEALALGLVNRVLPAEDLREAVITEALEIAQNAPLTVRCAKAVINGAIAWQGATADAELDALAEACYASADYREGRAAFLEKRKPVFKGE